MSKLIVQNLEKSYKARRVVNKVSLDLESGEIVGLLGPNGAGKTTAFYIIVGLIKAEGGQIFFDKENITHTAMHHRARLGIGYLPQEASVFRKLSVADNIMAILELRKDLSKADCDDELEKLLDEFHISHIRDNVGYSLSGGERRRVEIARTLAINPKFILLDEPFAGVDPISVIDIKHIIKHLKKRNIGILITDHNVRETLDICDRGYIMNAGETICAGSPDVILANELVREVYLGDEFEL